MGFRGRNFAFLVYPESCRFSYAGMVQYIQRLGVATAISPLHIPDDEVKKEHYHVLITFDGVKSVDSLENLTDIVTLEQYDFHDLCNSKSISQNDTPHFCIINSICGYYRYLVHKDNEKKQQFPNLKIVSSYVGLSEEDKNNTIVHLNGFNAKDYLNRDKKLSEDIQLINIINDNEILNESELLFFLAKNKNEGLIDYIHKNLYFVKNFLFVHKTTIEKIDEMKEKGKKKNVSDKIPF